MSVQGSGQADNPRELFSAALSDYFNNETSSKLMAVYEDGAEQEINLELFFRGSAELKPLEQRALELCRGRVLDIGAGTGPHSLLLQELGLSVCAIDISSELVDIMKARGVKDARQADVRTFIAEPFDTLLCIVNGVSMAGTLNCLGGFLRTLHSLTTPDGQLLIDSTDLRETKTEKIRAIVSRRIENGQFFGEVSGRLKYKDKIGPLFTELFVDPELLAQIASVEGWECRIVANQDAGRYLARLNPKVTRSFAQDT